MARPKAAKKDKKLEDIGLVDYQATWEDRRQLDSFRAEWNALEKRDALPPVILFHGIQPEVVALHVQAALAGHYCLTGSSCGHCEACLQIKQTRHPEVLWLGHDGTGLKVDDVPTIMEWVGLHVASGDSTGHRLKRTVVLGFMERITEQAANKLLKTIEEPESQCQFLLWTNNVEAMLDTIRSRSFHWHINTMASQEREVDRAMDVASGTVQQLLGAKQLGERLLHAETLTKEHVMDCEQIHALVEQTLNNCYRESLRIPGGSGFNMPQITHFAWRQDWRNVLSTFRKKWLRNRRTGFNAQLFAEALASVTSRSQR